MNTSTIKIYKNENFDANDNVLWDKLDEWKIQQETANKVLTFQNYQYQRINLEMKITVPISQSNVAEPQYNFVEILNNDTSRSFYFWIRQTERGGENSTHLYLTMDTILTFKDLILNHFTHETKIYRQHKDRFIQRNRYNYIFRRKVDKIPEVQGLIQYRKTKTRISTEKKWYLVYANENNDERTAIKGYLVPEEDNHSIKFDSTSVSYQGDETTFYPSTFLTDSVYIFKASISYDRDGNTVTVPDGNKILFKNENNTFDLWTSECRLIANGLTSFKTLNVQNVSYFDAAPLNDFEYLIENHWENLINTIIYRVLDGAGLLHTYKAGTISDITKTSTKLVSIIECPYCPLNNLEGMPQEFADDEYIIGNTNWFTRINIENEFFRALPTDVIDELTAILPSPANRINADRNMLYESKLYNSEFYTLKYVYDSFGKGIPLENLTPNSEQNVPSFIITYKQSNALKSDLGFQFVPYNVDMDKTEDYDEYLICSRQNNCPLYNSNYLNYMRNGYQYDVKNKNQQFAMNWLGTGIQIAGGVAGLLASTSTGGMSAGAGISLLTSGISSITSNIFNDIKGEDAIEQKKKQAQAQTNSVSASDDLNLLKWYNGNELLKLTYSISDVQKANIYELLYRCGYACYDVGAPNLYSRVLFNYIEADIDLDTKTKPEMIKYYADIKERFKKGVTVFHQNGDLTTYCTKENWETWLY